MDKIHLKRIFDDDDADEQEEILAGVLPATRLTKCHTKKFIWFLCNVLKINENGVPAQACMLFERTLSALIIKNVTEMREGSQTSRDWQRTMESQLPLTISVCGWLAVKMNTSAMRLNTTIIQKKLKKCGFKYSRKLIKKKELEIYSALNYRIPVWTTAEKAILLAEYVNIPQQYYDHIKSVVDMAEYRRHKVQERVERIARNLQESNSELRSMRNAHFCAGAVVASAHLGDYKDQQVVPNLAQLTKTTDLYIMCIADAISLEIPNVNLTEANPFSLTLKRKHQDDYSF